MKEIAELIKKGSVVAFCGAGLSRESGIPTFRGKDGLWEKYDPNLYVSIDGIRSLFSSHPDKLKDFIIDCYGLMLKASPNQAHYVLADLEKKGYLVGIITQNIDDFHFQAGSKEVAEVHGNAYALRCPMCNFSRKKTKKEWQNFIEKLKKVSGKKEIIKTMLEFMGRCQRCQIRFESGVVLFGQSLPESEIKKSYTYIEKAKIVLCVGTSGVVYPAASFPFYAKERGAKVVTVNPFDSALDEISDSIYCETAVEFFQKLSLHL